MKNLILLFSMLLSSGAFANEVCLPLSNSFQFEKIEKNVVTGKFQIVAPYYQAGGRQIPVAVSVGSKAHLCKFFGLSGGRVLSSNIECGVRQQLSIGEDGAYREFNSDNTFGCAKDYYITMLECEE